MEKNTLTARKSGSITKAIGNYSFILIFLAIFVAYLIIKQGREIKESVGCHYNMDYPKQ